jgi:hypothetical protein
MMNTEQRCMFDLTNKQMPSQRVQRSYGEIL